MNKKIICILLGIFLLVTLVVISMGSAADGGEPEPVGDHSNQDIDSGNQPIIDNPAIDTPIDIEAKHRF